MRLTAFSYTPSCITARIEFLGRTQELYYQFEGPPPIVPSADAFVVAMLLPAMRNGEPVIVEAPISPVLAGALPHIQEIFLQWRPGVFWPVRVHVSALMEQVASSADGGSFFSLGVDSFYTSLHAPSCPYLIYMHGIEAYTDKGPFTEVERRVKDAAAALGKKVISGSTNLRQVFDIKDGWGPYYHGAGLASVGHALGLARIYISSGHAIKYLHYWGSHWALDYLWSSGRTQIVHFGHVSRAEKTAEIASYPSALKHLRVCLHNDGTEANCGRCWKCVRTMLTLQMLGRLDGAPFPYDGRPLLPELAMHDEGGVAFADEMIDLLERIKNPNPTLLRALRNVVNDARRRDAMKEWIRSKPRLRSLIRKVRGIHIQEPPKLPLAPVHPVSIGVP